MRVLVTGGAGFIGSHLVDLLLAKGHDVWVVDDLSGGYERNLPSKGVTFFPFDLRVPFDARYVVEAVAPEVIFHLAANAAENKAQFSPIDITTRNWDTFINTITPAINHGLKRFVFTSSIAVYGAGQTPFKETAKPEPEDLYGVSKLAVEQSLKILAKVHEFEYAIARPHNVYGPRQNMADPYRNVVTLFMNALLRKEPHTIYGDGDQRRCFSYVDEVVAGIYECGFKEEAKNQTYNIGSDASYTVNELSRAIQAVAGTDIPPIYLPERAQEVKEAVADHKLARKVLGYRDKTSLEQGLRQTWEWAKGHGPQELQYNTIEIDSPKLPENWRV